MKELNSIKIIAIDHGYGNIKTANTVEEAEARNRVKEQKARTHRLIQEGALLESIAPSVRDMSMEQLKRELMICLRGLS